MFTNYSPRHLGGQEEAAAGGQEEAAADIKRTDNPTAAAEQ